MCVFWNIGDIGHIGGGKGGTDRDGHDREKVGMVRGRWRKKRSNKKHQSSCRHEADGEASTCSLLHPWSPSRAEWISFATVLTIFTGTSNGSSGNISPSTAITFSLNSFLLASSCNFYQGVLGSGFTIVLARVCSCVFCLATPPLHLFNFAVGPTGTDNDHSRPDCKIYDHIHQHWPVNAHTRPLYSPNICISISNMNRSFRSHRFSPHCFIQLGQMHELRNVSKRDCSIYLLSLPIEK